MLYDNVPKRGYGPRRNNRKEDGVFVYIYCLTEESGRSDGGEGSHGQSFLSSLSTGNTVGERKFDFGLGELHTVDTLQVLSTDSCCSDNLDGSRAGSVASSHLIVQL